MIRKCPGARCYSKFQDNRYGKQKRVFNLTHDNKWRCTICGYKTEGIGSYKHNS